MKPSPLSVNLHRFISSDSVSTQVEPIMSPAATGEDKVEITFRSARHSDNAALRKMMYALYKEDWVGQSITGEKISATLNELDQSPNRGQVIVFEEAGEIIGYAILIFYWSNEYGGDVLHIDELYVMPDFRQRGVATSFFNHISETFKHKARLLQLEVSPTNTKAMSYYRKLGFKQTRNVHLARPM